MHKLFWALSLALIGTVGVAAEGLSKPEADKVARGLMKDHTERLLVERKAEMDSKVIKLGELKMPFWYKTFGVAPKEGRSLYISLHGGGGAPAAVNDQQWENQKRLYTVKEGVYLAPRAPTNTWNLWHQSHIDLFFTRLIENLVAFENVNPNRVYVLGYSAGGDGVYQIGPRMADMWAAASMMAGHPNDARPDSLLNTPFSIQVGALDGAYKRNQVAQQWGKLLDELQKASPKGYEHFTKVRAGKGHWMDREDAMAIPWMAKYTRDPLPQRIVWLQDAETHQRFYWLAGRGESIKGRSRIVANLDAQTVTIETSTVPEIVILLNDKMLDLDQDVTVLYRGKTLYQGVVARQRAVIERTLSERGDRTSLFCAEIVVNIPE
ncbi:MAG: hypothetical protein NZ744_12880 [Pirellulaceae bacterium]|nr:hypothetical protein [Pirellulaceae bacterium]